MRLTAHDVSKSYNGVVALEKLSLAVESGSAAALVGPSGAGKSTLMGILAGFVAPDTGSVGIEGRDLATVKIQWIVQAAPVLERRTALDNAMLPALANGDALETSRAAGRAALGRVGLRELGHRRAFQLSGGQKQRLAIARAFVARPQIVLADEPTASLDRVNRDAVADALLGLARSGAIVVIATHDPYVADRCDQSVALALAGGQSG